MSQSSDDVPLAQLTERGAAAVDSAPQPAPAVKEEEAQSQQQRQQQAAAPAAAPAAAKPAAVAAGGDDDGSSSDDDAPLLARKAAVKQGVCTGLVGAVWFVLQRVRHVHAVG